MNINNVTKILDEIEALAETSTYARMLIAKAIADSYGDDNLRGFYDMKQDYQCRQTVRIIMQNGIYVDKEQAASVPEVEPGQVFISDGMIFRFKNKPKKEKQ